MIGRRREYDDPMERVRRVFDLAAPWYWLFDRFSRPLYRELITELRQHMPLTGETRVLEVCCGTGVFSRELAETCGRVIAVDISPRMIETARRYDETGVVDFRVADARHLALDDDGPFDLVIESLGLHALAPDLRADIVREMRRHARGYVLFIEPTGRGTPFSRAINDILERLEGGYDDYRTFISQNFSEFLVNHGLLPRHSLLRREERVSIYLCDVNRENEEVK